MNDTVNGSALGEAVIAAERAAEEAASRLERVRAEARERAARFAVITSQVGASPAEIRELADQVRLSDPATVEAAEIEVAEAAAVAIQARIDQILPTRPALEAEVKRRQLDVRAAERALWQADNAFQATFPGLNGMTYDLRDATRRLAAARERARAGAEARLAELTGQPATSESGSRS